MKIRSKDPFVRLVVRALLSTKAGDRPVSFCPECGRCPKHPDDSTCACCAIVGSARRCTPDIELSAVEERCRNLHEALEWSGRRRWVITDVRQRCVDLIEQIGAHRGVWMEKPRGPSPVARLLYSLLGKHRKLLPARLRRAG